MSFILQPYDQPYLCASSSGKFPEWLVAVCGDEPRDDLDPAHACDGGKACTALASDDSSPDDDPVAEEEEDDDGAGWFGRATSSSTTSQSSAWLSVGALSAVVAARSRRAATAPLPLQRDPPPALSCVEEEEKEEGDDGAVLPSPSWDAAELIFEELDCDSFGEPIIPPPPPPSLPPPQPHPRHAATIGSAADDPGLLGRGDRGGGAPLALIPETERRRRAGDVDDVGGSTVDGLDEAPEQRNRVAQAANRAQDVRRLLERDLVLGLVRALAVGELPRLVTVGRPEGTVAAAHAHSAPRRRRRGFRRRMVLG